MELLDAILQHRPSAAGPHLRAWGLREPDRAYANLRRLLAPLAPPDFGELHAFLAANLPGSFDPDRALNNLERYQQISAGALQPLSLARDRPYLLRLLLDLFGFSQFLSDVLIRYPHYVAWLGDPGVIDESPDEAGLQHSLERAMAPFTSLEKRQHAAVRWLRRELLRAGVRVMIERTDERQFTLELSRIAVAVIRAALAEAERPLRARFGAPLVEPPDDEPAVASEEAGFSVVAMGKLGGMELNFSSDVDLVFVYTDEGRTRGVAPDGRGPVAGRISNHDYFRRLAEGLIQFLTMKTEEGYLYRVDTRLRPDGAEGPLARSLGAFEVYYESQARPWERMALIKSRAIAGDERLGRRFESMSAGLVFGRAMGPELIGQVRDLKRRIDAGVDAGEEAGREIKRGRGGIREIEFLVQALQLLHGPRRPDLHARSTLDAIPALAAAGFLAPDEADLMIADYLLLRRMEHRLQMMDLRQTHTLPADDAEIDFLARRCGFRPLPSCSPGRQMLDRWNVISTRVHARFSRFFGDFGDDRASPAASPIDRLAALIAAGAPDKDLIPLLAPFGLDAGGAIAALRRMAGRGKSVYLSERAVELFPRVLPLVVEAAARSARPAVALVHLDAVLAAFGSSAALYEIFESRPRVLEMLVRGFGWSSAWAQTLVSHPGDTEILLDAGALVDPAAPAALAAQLQEAIASPAAADDEACARALARFRRLEALKTGMAECAGLIDYDAATQRLTGVADAVVAAALSRASLRLSADPSPSGFAVLAMGKHGSRELNYYSDLDLVFAWDDPAGLQEGGPARAEAVSAMLTRPTPDGAPYSLDVRLRPEGASAPLAPPLSRYLDYYAARAEFWEFQSFMKIRAVAGDIGFGERLIREVGGVIADRLRREFDVPAMAAAVRAMRARIESSVRLPSWMLCDFKKGPGGVIDLDFLAQFFQLAALAGGESLIGLAPAGVFARAASRGWIDPAEASALSVNYGLLRRLESRSRLLFETESSRAPAGGEKADSLGRAAADLLPEGEVDWKAFLLRVMDDNRRRFDRLRNEAAAGAVKS